MSVQSINVLADWFLTINFSRVEKTSNAAVVGPWAQHPVVLQSSGPEYSTQLCFSRRFSTGHRSADSRITAVTAAICCGCKHCQPVNSWPTNSHNSSPAHINIRPIFKFLITSNILGVTSQSVTEENIIGINIKKTCSI